MLKIVEHADEQIFPANRFEPLGRYFIFFPDHLAHTPTTLLLTQYSSEHGVHAHQVLRSIENPNDVTVEHTFDSPEAAREFFARPELKEAMSKAGVNADSVQISYFDEVESGTLVGV